MNYYQPDNSREDKILFNILYNIMICDIINYRRELCNLDKGVSNYLIVFNCFKDVENFLVKNNDLIELYFNPINVGVDKNRKVLESKNNVHNIYFCVLNEGYEKSINKFLATDFTCIYLNNIKEIDSISKSRLKIRCRNIYGFPNIFKEF